jgi:hypothetical protein
MTYVCRYIFCVQSHVGTDFDRHFLYGHFLGAWWLTYVKTSFLNHTCIHVYKSCRFTFFISGWIPWCTYICMSTWICIFLHCALFQSNSDSTFGGFDPTTNALYVRCRFHLAIHNGFFDRFFRSERNEDSSNKFQLGRCMYIGTRR